MRAGDLLRKLDRRLLPPLARGLARLGHGPVRFRVLTGVALLSSAAVLVTAVWAAERRPVGDPTVGEVTRVGVVDGDSIPGYVASSRAELADLLAAPSARPADQTYALVTLTAYLGPDRLVPVLADVTVTEVFARVPLPGIQTQIVRIPASRIPDDVVAGMLRVARDKDQEALDYEHRGAAVTGDGDRAADLRRWYDSGAEVARAEATGYRGRCSCLYAAVVRADATTLDRISHRPGVRAVDPAPEVVRLDRAVFSPPLPDQLDVVRPPADTGLPEPGQAGPPVATPAPPTDPASASAPAASPTGTAEPTAVPSAGPADSPPAASAEPSPVDVEESSPMAAP
nr:hypothetical protein [Micromonospora sp. DSM 115978]